MKQIVVASTFFQCLSLAAAVDARRYRTPTSGSSCSPTARRPRS